MTETAIAKCIDAFTVTEERALLTLPTMIAKCESELNGCAVFGCDFIADLIRYGVEHGVLTPDAVQRALSEGCAQAHERQSSQKRTSSLTWDQFERLSAGVDRHLELAALGVETAKEN